MANTVPGHIELAACEAFGIPALRGGEYGEHDEQGFWKPTHYIDYIWMARVEMYYWRTINLGVMSRYPWRQPSEVGFEGFLLVEGVYYEPFLGTRPFKSFGLEAPDDTVAPLLNSTNLLPPVKEGVPDDPEGSVGFTIYTFSPGTTGVVSFRHGTLPDDDNGRQIWQQLKSLITQFGQLTSDKDIADYIATGPRVS